MVKRLLNTNDIILLNKVKTCKLLGDSCPGSTSMVRDNTKRNIGLRGTEHPSCEVKVHITQVLCNPLSITHADAALSCPCCAQTLRARTGLIMQHSSRSSAFSQVHHSAILWYLILQGPTWLCSYVAANTCC